jgi:hypothetical protein
LTDPLAAAFFGFADRLKMKSINKVVSKLPAQATSDPQLHSFDWAMAISISTKSFGTPARLPQRSPP